MTALDPDRTIVERQDPMLGAIVGDRYQIRDRIAAGGFGAIYRALDLGSGTAVAVKVLHQTFASDPAVKARFRREGHALASLRDPHTVRVHDVGETPDGTLYIVMELLRGESLYEIFKAHGRQPWRRVAAIARAVCDSLIEAHAIGIVHRDLKPANIHLEPGDRVRVLDFGIAKVLEGSQLDDIELTHAGQMIGTFDYMPPEQMLGAACDARSDLFTLGVVIYEMITGDRPFGRVSSPAAMLSAVLGSTPVPMSKHVAVPPSLDVVVARCLACEPEARYPNAVALAAELDRVLAGDSQEPTAPFPRSGPSSGHSPTPAPHASPGRRASSPRYLAANTLPGVAPVFRPPTDSKPRLASGTTPIVNEPLPPPAPAAVVLPQRASRAPTIMWALAAVALALVIGLVIGFVA